MSVRAQGALVAFLGILYVAVSAGMIAFNKYLMTKNRFPFAVALVVLHTAFCSVFTLALFLLKPSLFPSLTDPVKKVSIDRNIILKGAIPIALLFSVQLVFSNTAYLHSSVAFLQMMKEANLVLVYSLSIMMALEWFSWRQAGILCGIIFATTLTIHGEINFSYTGFTLQLVSQFFECLKIVLQAMLLTSAGRKLDALTYVLLVMPLCFVLLCSAWGVLAFLWPMEKFATPAWSDFQEWWPYLLLNSLVAFTLNVVIALFVKHSSAVAFILAGIVKDAMIVAAGGLLFREVVSTLQVIGFTLQLLFILVWSLTKTFPDRFENGLLVGLWGLLTSAYPVHTGLGSNLKPDKDKIDKKNDTSYGTA